MWGAWLEQTDCGRPVAYFWAGWYPALSLLTCEICVPRCAFYGCELINAMSLINVLYVVCVTVFVMLLAHQPSGLGVKVAVRLLKWRFAHL
jgi:hypothetical protein